VSRVTRSERSCDAAAADEVCPLQGVWVGEFELALLRLMIELRENAILMELAVEELHRRGANISAQWRDRGWRRRARRQDSGQPADCRFKLLPQNLLFLLRIFS